MGKAAASAPSPRSRTRLRLYPNTEGCAALRRSWSAARRGLDEGGAWSRGLEHHLEALRAALPAGRAAGRDGAGASGSEAAAGGLGDGGGAGSPSSAAADAADAAAALLATPWGAVALLDHVAARHAHGLPPVGGLATAVQVDALRAVAAAVVARTMLAPGGEGGVGGGDAAAAARLRMSTGRLLGTLMDLMRAKEGDAPRLALFSAHDTTVLPLLLALQGDATGGGGDNLRQPELAWPPFASAVAVELWRAPAAPSAGGGLFVRALHDGEVVVMPCAAMPSAYLGGKGGACSLADWLAAIAPIAAAGPDEHAAECAGQPRKPAKAAP